MKYQHDTRPTRSRSRLDRPTIDRKEHLFQYNRKKILSFYFMVIRIDRTDRCRVHRLAAEFFESDPNSAGQVKGLQIIQYMDEGVL